LGKRGEGKAMSLQHLQNMFTLVETMIFPEWLKSNEKERERIVKGLGKKEGKMILEEIKKEMKYLTLDNERKVRNN
jgi:hypothetical protein